MQSTLFRNYDKNQLEFLRIYLLIVFLLRKFVLKLLRQKLENLLRLLIKLLIMVGKLRQYPSQEVINQ